MGKKQGKGKAGKFRERILLIISVVKSAGRAEAMREKLWGAGREATGRAPHGSGAP